MTRATEPATTLLAQRLLADGDAAGAGLVTAEILRDELGLDIATCVVNRDGYSLNSVNGAVTTSAGERFFFKFHAEEDTDRTAGEWYRAGLLADAGYPVDRPLHVVTSPRRQVLLYRWRIDERLADACLRVEQRSRQRSPQRTSASTSIERSPTDHFGDLDGGSDDADVLVAEQRALDTIAGRVLVDTLHFATEADVAAEPIHQLFHHRLVDPDRPEALGARAQRFYVHRSFALPGATLDWAAFGPARWNVNGQALEDTFADLLERARVLLHPANPALRPAVVAHGDAHNANVWRTPNGLVLFDPAFAGSHMPALLAEVKATFHNVWAHPFWLYHPAQSPYEATVRFVDGVLHVDTDWSPSPLRDAFQSSKADLVWRPLLGALRDRGWLHPDWRATVRAALFACPPLVMNLRSGEGAAGRDPVTSLVGLTVAMLAGSEGSPFDAWFDSIDPIHPVDAASQTAQS